jgi:DNA polymerase-3 subunit alpha
MVDDYINVKHGAKAEYAHPILIPVLEPTNGVILYQEQVMQIAREMGGYTLGGADLLRRAMGKKKVEEMAQQRSAIRITILSVLSISEDRTAAVNAAG